MNEKKGAFEWLVCYHLHLDIFVVLQTRGVLVHKNLSEACQLKRSVVFHIHDKLNLIETKRETEKTKNKTTTTKPNRVMDSL